MNIPFRINGCDIGSADIVMKPNYSNNGFDEISSINLNIFDNIAIKNILDIKTNASIEHLSVDEINSIITELNKFKLLKT